MSKKSTREAILDGIEKYRQKNKLTTTIRKKRQRKLSEKALDKIYD